MTTHNREEWFKGVKFTEYFEKNFKQNTINKPLINSRIGQYWPSTGSQREANIEAIWNNLAEIAISMIVSTGPGRKLHKLKWGWILPADQEMLRQAACEIVQNLVMNNQVIERLQEIGLSTPGFNLQTSNTNWLLTGDTLGIYAKQLIERSEIGLYQLVESEYFTQTPAGNIQIIGSLSDKTIKELI